MLVLLLIYSLRRLIRYLTKAGLPVCILFFQQVYSQPAPLRFAIYKGKDSVGFVIASRDLLHNEEVLRVESFSSFHVLKTLRLKICTENFLQEKRLVRTRYYQDINGRAQTRETVNAAPGFTTACLYFQEPEGVEKVYSEKLRAWLTIRQNGDKYFLTLTDGSINIYQYVKGRLVYARLQGGWASVELFPVQ